MKKNHLSGLKKVLKKRINFISASLVFLTTLTAYLLTLYPTVAGGDSGEFITVAYNLDVGHPPGYPLYILVGKLFTLIIPFGNIAWRINVMSAFFSALSVTVLYQLFFLIGKKRALAALAAFSFAFTNVVWSQAIIAEVYALNTFFFSFIIFVLYKWQETSKDVWLYFSFFLIGLGLSNHHMIGLLIPPVVIYFIVKKWKLLIKPTFYVKSSLFGLLGLAVYLYLPIRTIFGGAYSNPAMINHDKIDSWATFWNFFNRKIYGGTVSGKDAAAVRDVIDSVAIKNTIKETSETVAEITSPIFDSIQKFTGLFVAKINQITSTWNFEKISVIINEFFQEYYYIGLLFFIWGILWWIRKRQSFHLFLALAAFFTIFFLATFIPFGYTFKPEIDANNSSFYTPGLAVIACGIFYGLLAFTEALKKKRKTLKAAVVGLMVLVVVQFSINVQANYQRDNFVAYDFNRALLHALPANSVLTSLGKDNMTFPLYYIRNVENFEPQKRYKILYSNDPEGIAFRKAQYDNAAQNVYSDILTSNYKSLALVPNGFLYIFNDLISKELKECRENNQENKWACYKTTPHQNIEDYTIRGINKTNLNAYDQKIKGVYLVKLAMNADKEGNLEKRDRYFWRILNEIEQDIQVLNWVGSFYLQEKNPGMARAAYYRALKSWPNSREAVVGFTTASNKLKSQNKN